MVTLRPAVKWIQALAALLLLAAGPVVEPLLTQERTFSQGFSADPGKAIALKRQQPGDPRTGTRRSDNDDGPDPALANGVESTPLWAPAAGLAEIDSTLRRSPRFCGASPRSPPSA